MLDVGRSTFVRRGTLRLAGRLKPELQRRAGFTLVEMLVVIFVILAVTALAIGITAPDTQNRRLRETARQVGAFFQGAKALAQQTGRPVAVIIEPDVNEWRLARTLKYAEVPPPYAGDQLTSVAVVTSISAGTAQVSLPQDDPWPTPRDPANERIRIGDLIRFNFQGHYYPIIAVNPLGIRAPDPSFNNSISLPLNLPMPYQVTRQPTPSAAPDLELAESVVVDLGKSGPEGNWFAPDTAAAPYPYSTAQPIAIIFSPGGGVPSYRVGGQLLAASGPLYFLVGKVEKVALLLGDVDNNVIDLQTYWVAVNSQTGLVSTAENAGVRGGNPLNDSRDFVRKALSTGSR